MENMFEVIKILDGNTFEVTPFWQWHNENGVIVSARGYRAPATGEADHEKIKTKLMELLFGECVTLKDAVAIKDDALVCRVYIQDKDLADYFSEYQ